MKYFITCRGVDLYDELMNIRTLNAFMKSHEDAPYRKYIHYSELCTLISYMSNFKILVPIVFTMPVSFPDI
jgi:hypothetical protein